jgi:hypothetical protein
VFFPNLWELSVPENSLRIGHTVVSLERASLAASFDKLCNVRQNGLHDEQLLTQAGIEEEKTLNAVLWFSLRALFLCKSSHVCAL